MKARDLISLLILPYNPPSLFLFLGYIVFLLSIDSRVFSFQTLLRCFILISFVIVPVSGGLMLINRASDIKEDKIKGRENPFTLGRVSQEKGALFSLFFYSISLIAFFCLTVDKNIFLMIPFFVFVFITWWYSDNKYLGRLFGFRLKDNYVGEFFAYGLAPPAFATSIWFVTGELNLKAVVTIVSFVFLGIFSSLINDIKDISSDSEAGLNTIASKYSIQTLLRFSILSFVAFILTFIISTVLDVFEIKYLVLLVPLALISKASVDLFFKNWKITRESKKDVKLISMALWSTLLLLFLVSII